MMQNSLFVERRASSTPLRALLAAGLIAIACAGSAQVNVLTYHNDNARTGLNSSETILKPSNVNPSTFGLLFTLPVDGQVYAQPLYLSHVNIPGRGFHNVVYVATEHNSVYAFDADSNQGTNANPLWEVNLGPSVPNWDTGSGDITTEIGITGTPVISQRTGTIYVVAKTKEVDQNNNTIYVQRLHALSVGTGAEKFGGPSVISGVVNGIGDGNDGAGHVPFNSLIQHNRPGLLLVNNARAKTSPDYIYIAFASHGDNGPYHGWLMTYNGSTLKQTAIYNTTPNALTDTSGYPLAAGGIWQSGGGLACDNSNIYLSTGNGLFDPPTGAYGDTILKIGTTNLSVLDYFTPYNQDSLNRSDADLGSGGVMLLPRSVGSAAHPNLLIQAGKQGSVYLVDRQNMGQYGISDNVVQELANGIGGVWGMPAYFNGNVYFGPVGSPLVSIPVANGSFPLNGVGSTSPNSFGYPGPTPSVSSNGTTNGIVWAIQTDAYANNGPAVLHAYDASNLATQLYSSDATNGRDQLTGAVKFNAPTIANGKVYVGAAYSVAVFGLGQWAKPPVIKPASGNYQNSVTVVLSDPTPGAVVYYTTDGSIPTQASSVYLSPIVLTASTTFTARAFAPGYGASEAVVANYQVNAVFGKGTGLFGSYYNASQNPVGPATATRIDPTIDFDWNGSSPIAGVDGSNWAAEWSGTLEAECSTTYTIYTESDDGVRVWLDGVKIVDDWTYHGATIDHATVTLQGGKSYAVVIDYFQGGGPSSMKLFWSAPGMPFQIVPQSQLNPAFSH